MTNRFSGILLPVSSLPGRYGIGGFSSAAYDFIDWLREAGQTYWQILPLGPTSYGDSPYQSFSTYAGNPYFISLEALIDEGVLTREECDAVDFGDRDDDIRYDKLYAGRYALLRRAYERSDISHNPAYQTFMAENGWWVEDYALFMAVKGRFGGAPWTQWAKDIRLRWNNALDYYRRELYFDIEFQQYMQFKFFEQWEKLRAYAHKNGIKIIGDIPIYVSMDSADAWAQPQLFQLGEDCLPTAVAGCPPDGFSATGQLWGNPLYRWDYHRETGYSWWLGRLWYCFKLYDVVRIDHFRGFDEYYSIPYGEPTAVNGHWEKGPGIELFEAMRRELGSHPVIAEDLGYLTESVRRMVRESGFPGMKVLEFAFDARDSSSANDYLPHRYPRNCVVYTGTHDNETISSWFGSITDEERKSARDYLCDQFTPEEQIHRSFIALAMRSVADTCIIPMQDYLGLDNSARINQPSTIGQNWRWRLLESQLTAAVRDEVLAVTRRYGRLSRFKTIQYARLEAFAAAKESVLKAEREMLLAEHKTAAETEDLSGDPAKTDANADSPNAALDAAKKALDKAREALQLAALEMDAPIDALADEA